MKNFYKILFFLLLVLGLLTSFILIKKKNEVHEVNKIEEIHPNRKYILDEYIVDILLDNH